MVVRTASVTTCVGMHDEVQIAPVCHHPGDRIDVSVHGYEESEVGTDKRGLHARPVRLIRTQVVLVPDILSRAFVHVEMFYELLVKGSGVLRAVSVVGPLAAIKVWIKQHMDVV